MKAALRMLPGKPRSLRDLLVGQPKRGGQSRSRADAATVERALQLLREVLADGYSQKQIAEVLGLSPTTVNVWVSRRSNPSAQACARILGDLS